jgi:hypothetical protein
VKNLSLALLTLAVLIAIPPVAAQAPTIDAAMAGNTYLAAPDAAGAWYYNPAALASIAGLEAGLFTMENWKHNASAAFEVSGESDTFALNWGGYQMSQEFGLGAGYVDAWGANTVGVGFGKSWRGGDMAWGVNWRHVDPVVGTANNIFDVGLVGSLGTLGVKSLEGVRWGLCVRDLTGDVKRTWDLGLAFAAPAGLTVAADLADVTNEVESRFRLGVTKLFAGGRVKAGIGLDDGDLTFGATLAGGSLSSGNISFGFAWQERENSDNSLLIGASAQWGG